MIGGQAPSLYLEQIQQELDMDDARMDEILRSHVIAPSLLRRDNFTDFFESRVEDLLLRIERATGKQVDLEDLDKLSLDGEYIEETEEVFT